MRKKNYSSHSWNDGKNVLQKTADHRKQMKLQQEQIIKKDKKEVKIDVQRQHQKSLSTMPILNNSKNFRNCKSFIQSPSSGPSKMDASVTV